MVRGGGASERGSIERDSLVIRVFFSGTKDCAGERERVERGKRGRRGKRKIKVWLQGNVLSVQCEVFSFILHLGRSRALDFSSPFSCSGLWVWSFGFWVLDFVFFLSFCFGSVFCVLSFGFGILDLGFGLRGLRFRVQGLCWGEGFIVQGGGFGTSQ